MSPVHVKINEIPGDLDHEKPEGATVLMLFILTSFKLSFRLNFTIVPGKMSKTTGNMSLLKSGNISNS